MGKIYKGTTILSGGPVDIVDTDLAVTAPIELTINTLSMDAASAGVAGHMSGDYATKLDGITAGANDYAHPNHSGDVTSVADGAQTIAAKAVTLAKMNDMATASLIGRKTALTGVPEVLSKADALALLNVEDGANNYVHPVTSGNVHIPATGAAAQLLQYSSAGTAKWISASGDVTIADGGALTIGTEKVTYAKMQHISATDKLLGRATAGAGDPEEIACTAAGRALLDDANVAAQIVTLGAALNTLSNLGTTAINTSLISDTDNTDDLGSLLKAWNNAYINKTFTNVIAPHSDGTTAVQITKADGSTSVLNVDTTNSNVGIGTTGPLFHLNVVQPGQVAEASTVLTSQAQLDSTIAVEGAGQSYFLARDIANDIEFIMGTSSIGGVFAGSMTAHDLWLRTNNLTRLTIRQGTGNVGIGIAAPNENAILDVFSITKAFMPPRMTTTQRDNIATPTEGMVIFNITTHVLNFYYTSWAAV